MGHRKGNKIFINKNVAYIFLHNGKIAIIDYDDVDRIKQYTWRYNKFGENNSSRPRGFIFITINFIWR